MFVTKPKGTPGHHLGSSARHTAINGRTSGSSCYISTVPYPCAGWGCGRWFCSRPCPSGGRAPGPGAGCSPPSPCTCTCSAGAGPPCSSTAASIWREGGGGNNAFIRRQACLSVDRNGSCGGNQGAVCSWASAANSLIADGIQQLAIGRELRQHAQFLDLQRTWGPT